MTIEHLPIEQCPEDMVSYSEACMFLFCLGPGWRIPTRQERTDILLTLNSNYGNNTARNKLAVAWDTSDIDDTSALVLGEKINLGHLYLIPVRDI